MVAHNPSSTCMTIAVDYLKHFISLNYVEKNFHNHFCICEKSLLRLFEITYLQFGQFFHPQHYLLQWVPCIARFFAQNVNPASINQSAGTGSDYWFV